ncbi:MAG: hypothetical protein SWQ30_16350 [Thermodesulfobacteriota bacterium]|nr:hypothetical protein [Thermodesulfobacteriota bacterium]
MPAASLFPIDMIEPSEILSRHSEWVYFCLVMTFFISVTGVTLRRHFGKPYIKPLIVSVALMLTVGLFKTKKWLVSIFEGWGILGSILLALIAAAIPYGLCRGFGMPARKAFYVTYILFYILSWLKLPEIYYAIADRNLGLVNLALLVLFFVAIFKTVKFGKSAPFSASDMTASPSPFEHEIDHEADIQGKEQKLMKKGALRTTKVEIKTIDDIADALEEIHSIIEKHRNSVPREERERIALMLKEISKKEDIFVQDAHTLHEIFQRIGKADEQQLRDLRERLAKVSRKEKEIVGAEMAREEEKLKIEHATVELEQRLKQNVGSFNKSVGVAMDHVRAGVYPYDAKPHLAQARLILRDIYKVLKEMKAFEKRLLQLTKAEKKLLKEEQKAT